MAKQTGIIRLKGTIGGISFYKTADGHLALEKGGVDASRIKNDPAFQRTNENGSKKGRSTDTMIRMTWPKIKLIVETTYKIV